VDTGELLDQSLGAAAQRKRIASNTYRPTTANKSQRNQRNDANNNDDDDDATRRRQAQELPRLPVPDLWLTVSRYLASLKAVLAPTGSLDEMYHQIGCQLTRDQIEANWRQYERTEQLVKQFMLNEGPELQRDLKEYANKCQNWVSYPGSPVGEGVVFFGRVTRARSEIETRAWRVLAPS
jgi:hypothetical protein